MKRSELVQEVVDRGYDFLPTARIGTFVDHWYGRICARHNWPFLEETVSGNAPLEIADLDKILTVYDATQEAKLEGLDRRIAADYFPNLEEAGDPRIWYLEDDTLKTYPRSSNALRARCKKVAPKLAESDEPLIPKDWQYLIVEGAVTGCLKDDDEYAEARALKADVLEAVDTEMLPALIPRNRQNASTIVRTGPAGTYL